MSSHISLKAPNDRVFVYLYFSFFLFSLNFIDCTLNVLRPFSKFSIFISELSNKLGDFINTNLFNFNTHEDNQSDILYEEKNPAVIINIIKLIIIIIVAILTRVDHNFYYLFHHF